MPRSASPLTPASAEAATERRRRLQSLRAKLEAERVLWSRWLSRLKRAFHAMEKSHAKITRVEREIRKLETA
jgi:hypothetical protein